MDEGGQLKDRYVASLDVLGFSDLCKQDVGRLYDAYWTSVKILRDFEASARFVPDNPGVTNVDGSQPPGKMVRDYPHIYEVAVFSDSVFIFTDDDSEDSLNELCEFCYSIYQVFLTRLLALRGAIAHGPAIVDKDDKVYVGQAIINAHEIEKRLDLTGIVLADGLTLAASVDALVTFKPEKEGDAPVQKTMRVPVHRSAIADGKQYARNFVIVRRQSPEKFTQRYKNSEPVVAAMLKCDANDLKFTTDPDYVKK